MSVNALNFKDLVDKVQKPMVGAETLSIWGGECAADEILALVQQWPGLAEMPYRLWEYSCDIKFEDKAAPLPGEARWLERGRLFGPGGDLALRRDGMRFGWHFVGPKGVTAPAVGQVEDFWTTAEAAALFHQDETSALLWGERKKDFELWFDDRVAGAKLKYPVAQLGHLQVKYRTYSRAGRIEFVWWLGLEAYHG